MKPVQNTYEGPKIGQLYETKCGNGPLVAGSVVKIVNIEEPMVIYKYITGYNGVGAYVRSIEEFLGCTTLMLNEEC